MVETERRALRQRRVVRKHHRAQPPPDAWQKVARLPVPLVSQGPWGEWVWWVALLQALPALQQVQADESELPQTKSSQALSASRLVAQRQVREPAPLWPPGQARRAPLAQPALPLAQQEPRVCLVSPLLAPR
jgi:hypothetical protein